MRISYQFELAAGLCTLELDVRVLDNQFCVHVPGYESPKGTGTKIEEALLDFAYHFKQANAADLIDGRVFRNLPLPAQPT